MASMDVPAGGSTIKQAKAIVTSPAFISWTALAFMTTGSVASLRSSPTMAVYGLACVFLYVVPAIVFLLPQALVAAELASGWSGGVYRWVTEGLSGPWGLLAIWCQFAMTIFFPDAAGVRGQHLAYIFNPTWRPTASTPAWSSSSSSGPASSSRARDGRDRQARLERADHRHADPRFCS